MAGSEFDQAEFRPQVGTRSADLDDALCVQLPLRPSVAVSGTHFLGRPQPRAQIWMACSVCRFRCWARSRPRRCRPDTPDIESGPPIAWPKPEPDNKKEDPPNPTSEPMSPGRTPTRRTWRRTRIAEQIFPWREAGVARQCWNNTRVSTRR